MRAGNGGDRGPLAKPTSVVIDEGASLGRAGELLAYAGAVEGLGKQFYYLARIFGSDEPIQAGEFEIPAGASAAAVLDLLQHGKPVQRLVAVPEGTPSIVVYEKLMAIPQLSGAIPVPAEGSVLPDSYSYQRGESRAAVLKRMQQAMTKELDTLWAQRKPSSAVFTKRDAVTLASVVEKETGKASERRMVAGVYSNRLRIGMKLDADPTVIYPITKGKPLGRRSSAPSCTTITATTPMRWPGCRKDRSPIPAANRSPRCSIRRRPRRSISSPTAPAAMSSPTRSPSITPTSPNGMRSAGAGGDVAGRSGRSRSRGERAMNPFPEDVFTEPSDVDPDTLANLGPLTRLAGRWEAHKGVDLNPKAAGPERRVFIERTSFDAIDPQANGPQLFYGLRYHTHITTEEEDITFHEQVGYWLWEPATGLILQTLAIPRGQVALASGQGKAGDDKLTLTADAGADRNMASARPPSSNMAFAPTAIGST